MSPLSLRSSHFPMRVIHLIIPDSRDIAMPKVKVLAMPKHEDVGGAKQSPKRFNLDTNFMPLNSRGKCPSYPLDRMAGRSKAGQDTVAKRQIPDPAGY
jgi:hypothetical protein